MLSVAALALAACGAAAAAPAAAIAPTPAAAALSIVPAPALAAVVADCVAQIGRGERLPRAYDLCDAPPAGAGGQSRCTSLCGTAFACMALVRAAASFGSLHGERFAHVRLLAHFS